MEEKNALDGTLLIQSGVKPPHSIKPDLPKAFYGVRGLDRALDRFQDASPKHPSKSFDKAALHSMELPRISLAIGRSGDNIIKTTRSFKMQHDPTPCVKPLATGLPDASGKGFTLVELLVVCGIVAILVAIGMGVFKGAQEQGKMALARAELAALEAILENYRADNGDYPVVPYADSAAGAFLSGNWTVLQRGEAGNRRLVELLLGEGGGRGWIDLTQFSTLSSPTGAAYASDPDSFDAGQVIIDPWERVYLYFYDPTQPQWRGLYHLYSAGPGGFRHSRNFGRHQAPGPDGSFNPSHPHNVDNIYGGGY